MVIDANGCTTSMMEILQAGSSLFPTYDDFYSINQGESIMLSGMDIDSNYTYLWTSLDGSLTCNDCPEPSVSPEETVIYSVLITTPEGCTDSFDITVEVIIDRILDVYLPNVFSPNGDANNDDFIFTTFDENVIGLSMSVYDRWGNNVFTGQSADQSISWDGRMGSTFVTPGVYIYTVEILYNDGSPRVIYGDVSVVR